MQGYIQFTKLLRRIFA